MIRRIDDLCLALFFKCIGRTKRDNHLNAICIHVPFLRSPNAPGVGDPIHVNFRNVGSLILTLDG